MKKQLLYGGVLFSLIVFLAYIFRTTENNRNTVVQRDFFTIWDSVEAARKTDSLLKFDTIGVSKSGLKIISSEIKDNGILSVTYKNVSEKDISGIKFTAYCENALLEPATVRASVTGASDWKTWGILWFDDDKGLKKGDESTVEVQLGSWERGGKSDAKHVKLVWPTKIVFSDMSVWKSRSFPDYE
jgi:hypothetical protein